MITLYSLQAPGHDIRGNHPPLNEYGPRGAYEDISKYLKWDSWVWAFPELEDFVNEWLVLEKMRKADLWALSIPRTFIRWCALSLQCENVAPIETWFFQDPESVRAAGDIPEALIKAPVNTQWVLWVRPAKEALIEAGLLKEEL